MQKLKKRGKVLGLVGGLGKKKWKKRVSLGSPPSEVVGGRQEGFVTMRSEKTKGEERDKKLIDL